MADRKKLKRAARVKEQDQSDDDEACCECSPVGVPGCAVTEEEREADPRASLGRCERCMYNAGVLFLLHEKQK